MTTPTTPLNTAKLKQLGFAPVPETPQARMIVSVQGEEGTGKNHFAFTAPDPILVQSTDIGLEGMVEKFARAGKTIWVKSYKMPRVLGNLKIAANIEETCAEAEKFLATWERDYRESLALGVRTIVWDTASEVWEKLRWARGGRMDKIPPLWYSQFNEEYMNMVKTAYDHGINMILLHKVKDVWQDDKRTGRKERQGMSQTGYLVQVEITTMREGTEFSFYVDKCRANYEIQDQVLPAMTFQELALMVYPDSQPGAWE